MTFADMKARVARGVLRDDLADSYGTYINEALREIQNRFSFALMKQTANVTLPAGAGPGTVTLATNLKELQPNPAIYFVADDGGLIPAENVFESQQIFRDWIFWGTPISTWPPRTFFTRSGNVASLGMEEDRTDNFNFRVDYYGYLPDLVNDSDTSLLIDAYPQMVLAKAKAIAFTDINDADAVKMSEELYNLKLSEAMRQDAYAEVHGRFTHM